MKRRWIVCLLFAATAVTASNAETLAIRLEEGLILTDRKGAAVRVPLEIDLELPGPAGEPPSAGSAWAWTPRLPATEHLVRVISASRVGSGWKMEIEARIGPHRTQPLSTGGRVGFDIELSAGEPGQWNGTFRARPTPAPATELDELERAWGFGPIPGFKETETHRLLRVREFRLADSPWEGMAAATTAKPGPKLALEGSHPRLLFTKEQLPAIRKAAQTPEGQAIVASLRALLDRAEKHGFSYHPPGAEHSMGNLWAAGHAFLFQLTGDKADAQKAERLSRTNLFGNYYYGGGWIHPHTLIGLAYAYDGSGETWDPGFRAMVYSYLWKNARQLALCDETTDPLRVTDRYRFANDHAAFSIRSVGDSNGAQFRAAAALGALAILGDPTPVYRPPSVDETPRLEPAGDYDPAAGVPVLPFESDVMPREWLLSGPFLRDREDHNLPSMGGPGAARPAPGDRVQSDGIPVEWRHYRPSGASNPGGGAIYSRVCARYWASSTGGGYWPGIELTRRWARERGQSPSLNILIYTVVANDRDRIIQALPNWRSASCGNRMWLNGRELKDGDLVRIGPGLYPLVVDVEVVGGYSSQAPRLRDYTAADRRSDLAAVEAAAAAAGSLDPATNPLARSVLSIRRSLIRHAKARVGEDGWRVWEAQEGVLPFARSWAQLTGENLGAELRIRGSAPLLARLGETWDRPRFRYLAWNALPFLDPVDLGTVLSLARAQTEFRRPTDAISALVALASLPSPPASRAIPPAGSFPSHGIDVFHASGRDLLALVQSGNRPFTDGACAGHFGLYGFRRGWIEWRDGADPANGNLLAIGDLEPAEPATVVSRRFDADGSGSVVLDLNTFRKRATPGAGRDAPAGKAVPEGPRVRRFFMVDYASADGAVVLIADRIERAAFLEKIWRFDVGAPGGFVNERATATGHGIRYHEHGIVVAPGRPRDGSAPPGTLQIRVHAPAPLHWNERSGNREGTRRILEARLDRIETAVERETKQTKRAGDKQAPGIPGLDELERDLGEDTRSTQRAAAPPLWVCTILTLQPGEAPPVGVDNPGETTRVRVGTVSYRLGPDGWTRDAPSKCHQRVCAIRVSGAINVSVPLPGSRGSLGDHGAA
mgnify:CR=1 FL=1